MENFTAESSPCRNLLSTGHFHVDMDAYFIPPGCTGIMIPLEEMINEDIIKGIVNGISPGKYPIFEALYHGGISALVKLAMQHGFLPDADGYPSKCCLCFFIRSFLSKNGFAELDKNHYEEALKYY
jgi:hypothetical protein